MLPRLTPGYLMFFVNHSKLRAAERKWHKSKDPSDPSISLCFHHSLLKSILPRPHTSTTRSTAHLTHTSSSKYSTSPSTTTSLTTNDSATFFTNKTRSISCQFSAPQTQELKPTTSTAKTLLFCPLTDAEVSKLHLSSHPTTCPLDPIPSHLLQAISPTLLPALTHIINTSLLTGIFPNAFKQARVTPMLKKPTLNTSLLENYRPVSLLPFIAKTLERVVFNQLSSFLLKHNLLDANQSGFRRGHSTETALLCHWSPANCKSWFQIISPHSVGSVCCFWHC